jgi:hypothetical protein
MFGWLLAGTDLFCEKNTVVWLVAGGYVDLF